MTDTYASAVALLAWVFNQPATAVAILFVGWKLHHKLQDVIDTMDALSDPDKVAARMRPLLKEQAEGIGHDTRAALQPILIAMRGCGFRDHHHDDEPLR